MLDSLLSMAESHPTAHAVLVLSLVVVLGLTIGSPRYRGLRLGSAGVLFAGIGFSHFGVRIDARIAEFVKEFGLAMFVFMIGLQLGRGFFTAMRREGLRLNLLALAVVLLGSLGVLAATKLGGPTPAAAVGLLAGATTNTPSLAAAQQAMAGAAGVSDEDRAFTAMAYAVSYPMGILGIIGALAALRVWFRIDPAAEIAELARERGGEIQPVERRTLVLENRNFDGLALRDLPHINDFGVQVARHQRAGSQEVALAHGSTILHAGDRFTVVGTPAELDQFERMVGRRLPEDLASVPADLSLRRIVVTRPRIAGKSLAELHMGQELGVKVTRVIRGEIELAAFGRLRLQYGDVVQVVGEPAQLDLAADLLGNSVRALDETQFISVFLGVALGVGLGQVPLSLPGLPEPVRLGMAGGPLIVAIILGRLGTAGPLVWHVPRSAQMALRELGIILFLACVGLKAGERFVEMALSPRGAGWLAVGLAVAALPPLLVGAFARRVMNVNFATLSGVLAGSMTDPPALAFANGMCRSEMPSVGYASVYPVTMVLRIVLAQVFVVLLVG
ncbi:MAG: putative transporter [Phycisphaerales bacterium]